MKREQTLCEESIKITQDRKEIIFPLFSEKSWQPTEFDAGYYGGLLEKA
jgi:hypothetical protein